jgi:iron complex outermembrane receptor protein
MIRYVLNTLGSFRSALAAGVGLPLLVAASAYAQAPATPEATTERVIVTGSYIPTAETESALPVTVYTAEVLHKQGANTPVEGLRQLPSFVGNAATENDSNGGDGTATINLRGIGSVNTLVLLNGRRMFNQLGTSADINLIPIGAISRTEVLKDGASAIYGSDAVAGVVNFILINGPGEKPYEGAEIFALYGNTTDSDAHVRQVYVKGGVTGLDGKVSIAAEGEYYSRANLYSRDRFAVAGSGDLANDPTGLGLGGVNSNSPTYAGRISVLPGATALGFTVTGQLVLNNLTSSGTGPGGYRAFAGGLDPSQYNFRAFTPAIPSMEKANYFITGRYKIFGEGLQLYGDLMYSKVKQDNGLAGAPFNIGSGIADARASQFNPAGSQLASVRYRLQQDLGNRRSFFDKDYWRYVVGINGDFNIKDNSFISRFGYDSGYVYTRFDEQEIDRGDATRSGILAAIRGEDFDLNGNQVFFNPFIGQNAPLIGNAPTFVNGVPTGLTAPYNNIVGAQAASYVGHSFFLERAFLYDAKVNMHLFPNLWNGGIDLAVGYEHREVNNKVIADPVQRAGDQLGFNAADDLENRQEVDSVFTELIVPIVTSTMNVPFVRSLELSLAWRYEKFTDTDLYAVSAADREASFDNVNDDENFGGTPRVSLRYQPIADITLRASWGQSFRSPLPSELFLPIIQDFPVLFDPGTATVPPSTGQPPGGVFRGGNTALLPEKSDAYTAGIVWTPKFLPGFTMTMDWYQIFTTDLILSGNSFAQVELTNNVVAPFIPDPNFQDGCGIPNNLGIIRDPNDGTLFCVNSHTGNAGKRNVQGLDVTATYEVPTERFGKFTFSGGWNHFFTWKAQPGVGPFNSFLGNYNNGTLPLAPGAIPWNKGFLRTEWQWRHFDFVATGNYIGDFVDDPAFSVDQSTIPPGGPDFTGRRRLVPSYITLDMQLSYEFVKPVAEPMPTAKDSKDSKNVMQTAADSSSIWQRMLWGTTLTVGVNNAFDRNPPTVLGAFNDNYDTSLYTIRNRFWYVSLDKKF